MSFSNRFFSVADLSWYDCCQWMPRSLIFLVASRLNMLDHDSAHGRLIAAHGFDVGDLVGLVPLLNRRSFHEWLVQHISGRQDAEQLASLIVHESDMALMDNVTLYRCF